MFRAAITLVLGLHVFTMYSTARGMGEHFGFHTGTTIIAALFALAMLLPLVWAVALPELPEALTHSILPLRRWKQGRCPACAYDMRGFIDAGNAAATPPICPECGTPMLEPPPPEMLQLSVRTARRYITLNLLAWLLGCATGETLMQIDEHAFRNEVQALAAANTSVSYMRPRWWPNRSCSLGYRTDAGYFATE